MHPLRPAAAALALACAVLPLVPAPAHAAPVTWAVVPSSAGGPNGRAAFEYKLDPGATLTDYAGVANYSDRPITVEVYASDAFTTPGGGFDLLPADRPPTDVGAWVTFDARSVTVPAKSRLDVPFRLRVPADATPGDHAGGVVASIAGAETAGGGHQVIVDRRAGARIYLRVSGALAPALTIERAEAAYTTGPHPLRGGTLHGRYLIRNTGNVRLGGRAVLVVEGPFGLGRRRADLGPLPEILPGQTYAGDLRLDGVAPLGRLSATVSVVPVAPGQQVLDPPPAAASGVVPVWAWPWPQLLALLATAGAGVLALWGRRRYRRRRADALEQARRQGRAEALEGEPAT